MADRWIVCAGCARHVFARDAACPFCGAPSPGERRAGRAPAGAMAVALTIGIAASACGGEPQAPPPSTPSSPSSSTPPSPSSTTDTPSAAPTPTTSPSAVPSAANPSAPVPTATDDGGAPKPPKRPGGGAVIYGGPPP